MKKSGTFLIFNCFCLYCLSINYFVCSMNGNWGELTPFCTFFKAVRWDGLDSFPVWFWPPGLMFDTPGIMYVPWLILAWFFFKFLFYVYVDRFDLSDKDYFFDSKTRSSIVSPSLCINNTKIWQHVLAFATSLALILCIRN